MKPIVSDHDEYKLECIEYANAYSFLGFRGDKFCRSFASLGQLRSLIPESTNVLALTATATKLTFEIVADRLGLMNPAVVATSCNRSNIKLLVKAKQTLEEFSFDLSQKLKSDKRKYPKTIVFCRSYKDCTDLYVTSNSHGAVGGRFYLPHRISQSPRISLCIYVYQSVHHRNETNGHVIVF